MRQTLILMLASTGFAQIQNPMSTDAKQDYGTIRNYVIRAAEKMAGEDYGFQPTPEMRTFGQLIGHIADDQYNYCSAVMGEKRSSSFEKAVPPKAEMVAGLKAAFAYCNSAYDAMADNWAQEQIKFSGRDRPRLAALMYNTQHAWEHYGNVVVYMRLKGLVPPSSERGPSNPLSADAKADYTGVRDNIIKSAEKMSDANYAFRPTPEVRTFGQLVAHVADDQYNICSQAKGETRHAAYSEIEQTVSSKADLLAALKQAFAYCDSAYDSLTDATAAQLLTPGKGKQTKLGMLNYNTWHTWDHYGNMVVYMRLKGLVPPSSERMK